MNLADETYIAADPAAVAAAVADPARWPGWWPDLSLAVFMDRGLQGIRWSLVAPVTGSCEIWLEPVGPPGTGVVLHHYLRLDHFRLHHLRLDEPSPDERPDQPPASQRRIARVRRRRALNWKVAVWALKDELESLNSS